MTVRMKPHQCVMVLIAANWMCSVACMCDAERYERGEEQCYISHSPFDAACRCDVDRHSRSQQNVADIKSSPMHQGFFLRHLPYNMRTGENRQLGNVSISKSPDGCNVSMALSLHSTEAVSQYIVSLEAHNAEARRLGFQDYFTVNLLSPSTEQVWLNLTCTCPVQCTWFQRQCPVNGCHHMAALDITLTAMQHPADDPCLFSQFTHVVTVPGTSVMPDIVRVTYLPTKGACFVLKSSRSSFVDCISFSWCMVTNASQPLCRDCFRNANRCCLDTVAVPREERDCQIYFLNIKYQVDANEQTKVVYYTFPRNTKHITTHITATTRARRTSSSFTGVQKKTVYHSATSMATPPSPTRCCTTSSTRTIFSTSGRDLNVPLSTIKPASSSLAIVTYNSLKSSTPASPSPTLHYFSHRSSSGSRIPVYTQSSGSASVSQANNRTSTDATKVSDVTSSAPLSSRSLFPGDSSTQSHRDSDGEQAGMWIGVGVGLVVLVALAVAFVLCFYKRCWQGRHTPFKKRDVSSSTGNTIDVTMDVLPCNIPSHHPQSKNPFSNSPNGHEDCPCHRGSSVHDHISSPMAQSSGPHIHPNNHDHHLNSHSTYPVGHLYNSDDRLQSCHSFPRRCHGGCKHLNDIRCVSRDLVNSCSHHTQDTSLSSLVCHGTTGTNSYGPCSSLNDTSHSTSTSRYNLVLLYGSDDAHHVRHVTEFHMWLLQQLGEQVTVRAVVISDEAGIQSLCQLCQQDSTVTVLIFLSKQVRDILCNRSQYSLIWKDFICTEIGRRAASYISVWFTQECLKADDIKYFCTTFSAEKVFEISDCQCEEFERLMEELEKQQSVFSPPSLPTSDTSSHIEADPHPVSVLNDDRNLCSETVYHGMV